MDADNRTTQEQLPPETTQH